MRLDQVILQEADLFKPIPGEDTTLETVREILRKRIGTKDQRNAIMRIVRQVEAAHQNDVSKANLKKALVKLSLDVQVKI